MPETTPAFTMQDFLITMSVIFVGVAYLAYSAWKHSRRMKRKADQWPTATHKYFDKKIEKKLRVDYDPTQDIYN
jgi:cbb3-type cytochrome oxidase subunit 3